MTPLYSLSSWESDIERVALKVGLKINRMKTKFLLIGKWDASVSLTISSGPIKKVDDFKDFKESG